MQDKDLLRNIRDTSKDRGMSLDERIKAIMALRPDFDDAEDDSHEEDKARKKEKLRIDLAVYIGVKDLIEKEEAYATHILELMMLYALIAETYVALEDFRPLDDLAFRLREILRDNRIDWSAVEETLPRFIDAMKDSVYHYETYRVVLVYLRMAFDSGHLDEEVKEYARLFLKLRLLLNDSGWGNYLWDRHLAKGIADLFTSEEMLKIIMRPSIGYLRCDPVEYTPEWERIYYDVEDRLNDRFVNVPRQMGFCFMYWSAKKELLREEYGIDWHTPSQMNPGVKFD